jgi:hypothetical protein
MQNTELGTDFFIAYCSADPPEYKNFAKELKNKKHVPVRADYDGWLSAWVVRLQASCVPKAFKQHNHG